MGFGDGVWDGSAVGVGDAVGFGDAVGVALGLAVGVSVAAAVGVDVAAGVGLALLRIGCAGAPEPEPEHEARAIERTPTATNGAPRRPEKTRFFPVDARVSRFDVRRGVAMRQV